MNGYGVYHSIYFPESGPSKDDEDALVKWFKTAKEAQEYCDTANEETPKGEYFSFKQMTKKDFDKEFIDIEKQYAEAVAQEKAMQEKIEAGLITESEFWTWYNEGR
jgi:hypothetical protein